MIEKTYAGEKLKVEMEQAELDELMACEREKAYWQGRENGKQEGNERMKKSRPGYCFTFGVSIR
ncbi:MAG TPA: hypothetical protein H9914_06680 [Candidatus Blautia avicola]|uniref:Uncharacterized protein n=1 Tax=Candidatus Blautia avicola TaxID=2838483 RepID=A0A9D2TW34_9FIRM|nr:hypothetical protein [Candidatus Blautia avicola]